MGDWGEREGKGREGGGNERVEVWTEVLGWDMYELLDALD